MEFSRAGEVMLRYSLMPILTPAACRASRAARATEQGVRQYNLARRQYQPSRSFATGLSWRQQATSEAQRNREPPSPSKDFPSTAPRSQSTVNDNISSLLDGALDLDKGTPASATTRTSRFSSRNAQAHNQPSRHAASELRSAATAPSSRSAMDSFIDGMLSGRRDTRQKQANRSETSVAQMIDPFNFVSRQKSPPPDLADRPAMKLGPKVGRTIHLNVARNMDLGRAFKTLEVHCARNSVRRDFNRQRFHERPGLKRKRLKSERWRRNFKNQFKATVQMVLKMKRQGW